MSNPRLPADELTARFLAFEKQAQEFQNKTQGIFYMIDAVLEEQGKEIKKLRKKLKKYESE